MLKFQTSYSFISELFDSGQEEDKVGYPAVSPWEGFIKATNRAFPQTAAFLR